MANAHLNITISIRYCITGQNKTVDKLDSRPPAQREIGDARLGIHKGKYIREKTHDYINYHNTSLLSIPQSMSNNPTSTWKCTFNKPLYLKSYSGRVSAVNVMELNVAYDVVHANSGSERETQSTQENIAYDVDERSPTQTDEDTEYITIENIGKKRHIQCL